ncbi:MAG: SCO family protein [Magnetospirillum sp.]|nr:SCO family protein [Magnetospirillum sp.]
MRMRLLAAALAAILAAGTPTSAAEGELTGRFMLDTVDGKRVTDEAWRGKVRVVTFGYTFCPDICPTTLSTLSVVIDRLGADSGKVAMLFISVDPERDTKSHLKDYLSAFPGITGLTGSPEMVAGAARNFRARYERQPSPDGDPQAYAVDHSAGIYIMGRDGRFAAKLGHMATPDEVTARIRAVLEQP